jgi:hypothetical protein
MPALVSRSVVVAKLAAAEAVCMRCIDSARGLDLGLTGPIWATWAQSRRLSRRSRGVTSVDAVRKVRLTMAFKGHARLAVLTDAVQARFSERGRGGSRWMAVLVEVRWRC